ncbi:unnamed protein product, partial [Mesorhabditis belari]|uniref:Uncharacterized protein n=1 Tax=Mesorhabditis belari TaxID=2138241 RepID=A0AAF3FGJ3_9BILA
MVDQGFWLFEGLEEEPYGLLPLVNLSAKGGPTTTKQIERVGSYQWHLQDESPTVMIPGAARELTHWPGGKLPQDHGVIIYDVNHMKIKKGSLDPVILAAKLFAEKRKKPVDFGQYHFITDAVNLQKLFAFAQEAGDGLFRIDCERVGRTILLNRVEASDLMEIGHCTFDKNLQFKISKPRGKFAVGPYFQLISYTFGNYKFLVRFEVDCADYAAVKAPALAVDAAEALPEKKKLDGFEHIEVINYGDTPRDAPLQLITTYPEGAGFPFFTWAQLFFTSADQEIVGFFKGNGDFKKPPMYGLQDVSKLLKPLPYVVLSKVHDCLDKIFKFLTKNESEFKCALIWKGKNHLEIFAKEADKAEPAVSDSVRAYLKTMCKDETLEDVEEEA